MRADLMAACATHQRRGWTQSKAAKELGITQPVYRTDERCLAGFQRRHAAGVGFSSGIATYIEVGRLVT